MAKKRALVLGPRDNVASVLEEVFSGDEIAVQGGNEIRLLQAAEDIPFGFKVAIADIPRGDAILKYGEAIGRASRNIAKGALVHVHNIEGIRGRGDLRNDG